MVLKRTENILICIVIVYSAKILEFTAIKYFQNALKKFENWEVCIMLCLFRPGSRAPLAGGALGPLAGPKDENSIKLMY